MNETIAKITWLGEGDQNGPKETTLGHHRMPLGEAVEVSELRLIGKAHNNKYFKVEGGPKTAVPPPLQPGYQNLAPSQQDAQGSVAKPGEPASSPPQPPLPVTELPPAAEAPQPHRTGRK